jgi:hypothetical protein
MRKRVLSTIVMWTKMVQMYYGAKDGVHDSVQDTVTSFDEWKYSGLRFQRFSALHRLCLSGATRLDSTFFVFLAKLNSV